MARMRIPAAQVQRGDQFVVPGELFARGKEHPAGGVTLTVQDVEAFGRGHIALYTDRGPLSYRLDEWIYIFRPKTPLEGAL